jgi:hypothetical protein
MATIDDYVSRVEGTCGAEKDVIVVFKYEKKDEAIANILKKATIKNKIAGIIFELTYQDISSALYQRQSHIPRCKNKPQPWTSSQLLPLKLNSCFSDILLFK